MLKKLPLKVRLILSILSLSLVVAYPSQAQQIIPNDDGTMTIVTKDGNRFDIEGGKLSGDGKNLFHSLREFGLDAGQIANFLSNANIQNILTRINGGNPSVINGLIQVTGGNANLYLMNPSGIIFGENASLNVGGDFIATTAKGIGFNGGWFNANGMVDYSQLIGNPNALQFGDDSGVIINAGNLKVMPNQNIALVGGMVINTGTIETEGGKITVSAVPNSNRIRITPEGSKLSFEVEIPTQAQEEELSLIDIQGLLIGLPPQVETGVEVTENGTVALKNSGLEIPTESGTTIVSGNLDASNLKANALGGEINVQGENIGLIDANLNVSGENGGGEVLIGADKPLLQNSNIATSTFINQNSTINSNALNNGNGGTVIVLADDQTIVNGQVNARGGTNGGDGGFVEFSANNNLVVDGEVDLSAPQGNLGTLLFDPENITIVDGDMGSNDDQLTDNQILAGDSPGEDFTISELTLESLLADANVILEATNNITINDLSDDTLTFASGPGGDITFTADADQNGIGNFSMNPSDSIIAYGRNISISGANVTVGSIITRSDSNIDPLLANVNGGNITLTATNGNVDTTGGTLDSSSTSASGGAINLSASENISTGSIISQSESNNSEGRGGDINLSAGGNIDTTIGQGVELLETTNDSLVVPVIDSSSLSGDGGNINITADGNIQIGLIASGWFNRAKGGDINIESFNGSIDATTLIELQGEQLTIGLISSLSNVGDGGNVNLTAPGDINTGIIFSGSLSDSNGGNVTINSTGGSIDTSKGANISNISPGLLIELGVDPNLAQLASQAKVGLGIITVSDSGNGGDVNLNAFGDIITSNIITGSLNGDGGDITLFSQQGIIDTTPGRLFENVSEEFATGLLVGFDVDSSLASDLGSLFAYFSDQGIGGLISLSLTGDAGSISLTAEGNITTQYLIGSSFSGQGGNLSILSNNGQVEVRNIMFNAANSILPTNAVTNNPEVEQIVNLVSGGAYNTSGAVGGNITVEANDTITSAAINSSGSVGDGGDVSLEANGDIQVGIINAQGGDNGRGGDVEISTSGRLRVTDSFLDRNQVEASISTAGGLGDGSITIDLFPGDLEENRTSDDRLPFVVGDASENGTAGLITNSNFTILEGEYFSTQKEGNISLLLLDLDLIDADKEVQPPISPEPIQAKTSSPVVTISTTDQAKQILQKILEATAEKPALIYVNFIPSGYNPSSIDDYFERMESLSTREYEKGLDLERQNTLPSIDFFPNSEDKLDLLIVTSEGKPIRVRTDVTREEVVEAGNELWVQIANKQYDLESNYQDSAAKLYSWLVAPLEDQLEAEEIENLLFIMPKDLRLIPIAALYDETNQQFLVEKYSSGFAPSLNLNKNTYRSIKNLKMLAMGASEFKDPNVEPLPGVQKELPAITSIWEGKPTTSDQDFFINQDFTLEKIRDSRDKRDYLIVHFATHGEFDQENIENRYIQLYDRRLNLKELRGLDLNEPLVELLVFSACKTAIGNENIELGFAGLAVNAGVKTALGSLWYVGDEATLKLMTNFYEQLKTQPIKAEALRQAQLSLLKGEEEEFKHPYYWSSFIMIGNPW